MNYELKILKPEEIKAIIISFFRDQSIIPIVGAGLSCGVSTNNGKVPNGEEYKDHMLDKLFENSQLTSEEKTILNILAFEFAWLISTDFKLYIIKDYKSS